MSQAAENANNTITQWVTFYLDNEKYGIKVMQVQEVLRMTEVAPVPGGSARERRGVPIPPRLASQRGWRAREARPGHVSSCRGTRCRRPLRFAWCRHRSRSGWRGARW